MNGFVNLSEEMLFEIVHHDTPNFTFQHQKGSFLIEIFEYLINNCKQHIFSECYKTIQFEKSKLCRIIRTNTNQI